MIKHIDAILHKCIRCLWEQLWKCDEIWLAGVVLLPPSALSFSSLWGGDRIRNWPTECTKHLVVLTGLFLDEYPKGWISSGPFSFLLTLPFRLTLCTPALSLFLKPFHPFPHPSCDYLFFPSHWPFCCEYDTPPSAQYLPGLALLSHTYICRRAASFLSSELLWIWCCI